MVSAVTMEHAKNLLIALTAAVIFIFLVELGLQTFDYPPAPTFGWDWERSPYKRASFAADQVNELGYRGQPVTYTDQDYVVLLLGDSAVEAGTQTQQAQPERILQFVLQQYGITNARVFSLASAGWSFDQQLIALKRYFERYRADAVIHWLVPGNDFWEAGNIDRSVTLEPGPLKPTFRLHDDGSFHQYEVRAFKFKIGHLLARAYSRLAAEHRSDSSIAVRDYERTLPSAERPAVSPDTCPSAATLRTDEAVEHSRSHLVPALVPLSARDTYFVKLAHALQKAIERETDLHRARYLPVVIWNARTETQMTAVRCVVAANSGKAYRLDWRGRREFVRNGLIGPRLLEVDPENIWRIYVSDHDAHLNLFGNFSALNEIARAVVENKNARMPAIDTLALIHRSGMLTSLGEPFLFSADGPSSSQPLYGFHDQEREGRWTTGDALVVLDAGEVSQTSQRVPMFLLIDGSAAISDPRQETTLNVVINEKRNAEIPISAHNNGKRICIDFDLAAGEKFVAISLRSRERSLTDLRSGDTDRHPVGFFLRKLNVIPASRDDGPPC
jgi:hypothetical protein